MLTLTLDQAIITVEETSQWIKPISLKNYGIKPSGYGQPVR